MLWKIFVYFRKQLNLLCSTLYNPTGWIVIDETTGKVVASLKTTKDYHDWIDRELVKKGVQPEEVDFKAYRD